MYRKRLKIVILMSLIIILFSPLEGKKKSTKELPPRFKRWLQEEVVYIITPKEKEVFLKLESDRERDMFIEAFWKQRDPTPGTPENEFKTEHYRRIEYANNRLGVGSPKAGWRTDRGRIYIILGEPMSRDSYTTQMELRDTEIWFYNEMTKYGLPMAFNVVFYRKGLGSDYELYSPNNDGPQAFFIQTQQLDPADYITHYERLMEINSNIASVSLSLIPGETALVSDRPSLASDLLMQSINFVPQKEIKDLYAEKFLKYKSIVEVEYSANYIDSEYLIQTIRDDSGLFFVHYLISPERLSIGQYGNNYYARFILNGNVTDNEGKLIYQFEKEYSMNFDEDKIQSLSHSPFQINDMFPLIPGNYTLSLLLKNAVSKEFTSFEKKIFIPEEFPSPEISSLLLCYSAQDKRGAQEVMRPFQVHQKLLFTQPKNIFLSLETMTIYFQIYGLTEELKRTGKLIYSFLKGEEVKKTFSRDIMAYSDPENILEEISLSEFPAANYVLKVTLKDPSGQEMAFQSKNFSISPVTGFARPFIKSKALPASNDALNDFRIGSQLFNKGKYEDAASEFERAMNKKPGEMDFAIHLAKTYFILRRYEDIETILTPFLGDENVRYELYFYLGKSAQARNNFAQAVSHFREAITRFGLNVFLLNALGDCFFNLNNIRDAQASWEKSLEINPDQPQIREKLAASREKK